MRLKPKQEVLVMKKSQEALFGLLFMLIYPLISGFSVAVAIYMNGVCFKTLVMSGAWLASLCILWCLPTILQKISKKKKVLRDERDILIFKNAALTAHAVSWLYFLSACLLIGWNAGADGTVSVNTLPLIFFGGIIIFQIALVFSSLFIEKLGR